MIRKTGYKLPEKIMLYQYVIGMMRLRPVALSFNGSDDLIGFRPSRGQIDQTGKQNEDKGQPAAPQHGFDLVCESFLPLVERYVDHFRQGAE